jgi:hypothetical protein
MKWMVARAMEPSTYAGVAGILAAIAAAFPASVPYVGGAAVVAGSLAAALKEGGAK